MDFSSKYVIITAGGSGKRMESDIPKQMLEIAGKPILRHTIERFRSLPFDVKVILVINSEIKEMWKDYCRKNDFIFKHIVIDGGITRFHSVKKGLKYVAPGSLVAVHDAVRPFISKAMLVSMFDLAAEKGAAVPAVNVVDSMREKFPDGKTAIVDRSNYLMVQTPQIFQSDILLESYNRAYVPEFTDDASVVEKAGYPLSFCEGNRLNIKITTPDDLEYAKAVEGFFTYC